MATSDYNSFLSYHNLQTATPSSAVMVLLGLVPRLILLHPDMAALKHRLVLYG